MRTATPFLPGFSHHLCGRPAGARPARRLRDDAHRLDGLAALVARFIPPEVLAAGAGGRERVFTAWVTFIAFLGQVLTRGGTCREAVRRVQAWSVSLKRVVPDASTAGIVRLARGCLWRVCTWSTSDSASGWRGISAKAGSGAPAR